MILTPSVFKLEGVFDSYIESLSIKTKNINIYIDIQNLSIIRYDSNVAFSYMQNDSVDFGKIYSQILTFLLNIFEFFAKKNYYVRIHIYNDFGRNIFQENLLKDWKGDRIKSLMKSRIEDKTNSAFRDFGSELFTATIKSFDYFINTTKNIYLYNMEYIDSDFFPMLNYMKEKYENIESLHLIISSDHDYIHMLNNDEKIMRFYFLNNDETKLDSKFNVFKRCSKRYNLINLNESILVSKYYNIFQTLIGDSSDGVKSLINKKGIKFWIKKFQNLKEDQINKLEDKYFLIDEDSDIFNFFGDVEINKNDFIKRMILFDFYYVSIWLLHHMGYKLNENDEKILDKIKYIEPKNDLIIENNAKMFNKIYNKNEIKDDDLIKIFNKFNMNSIYNNACCFWGK